MRPGLRAIVAALLLAGGASARAACGALEDPNSDACMSARASAAAASRLEKGKGQTVCAFFDEKSQRCLTVRPDTKLYDSAVRTGIETAMMGMQIMADGREEARRMGVLGGAGAAPGASSAYNDCIRDGLERIAQAQKAQANPDQVSLVLKGCAR
ncbi:hypothetical protein [Telluria beijingensis]|uniref:hypothetical protein n=1 Tax=Telluria beijingensis TaxID=3068633 RepID=UPI002795FE95|nr:hypothetical protein [Massilia sp. REN29]